MLKYIKSNELSGGRGNEERILKSLLMAMIQRVRKKAFLNTFCNAISID